MTPPFTHAHHNPAMAFFGSAQSLAARPCGLQPGAGAGHDRAHDASIVQETDKDAVRFEAGSYRLMRGLAENLVPLVDDDQASDLRAALSETQATPEDNIDRLNAAICTLGTSIDRVILGEDGRKPLSKEARLVLLDYGEASSLRDRVWFRGNGIDPDRESLPPLEDVI